MERIMKLKVSDYFRPPSPPTRLPFRIRAAGLTINSPYHSTLGTYNEDAMLTLFVDGSGSYRCGKTIVIVSRGMLGLVLPGKDTGILMSNPDDPYEHFYCRFAGAEALKSATRIQTLMGGASFIRYPAWHIAAEAFRQLVSAPSHTGSSVSPEEKMSPADGMLAYLLAIIENSYGKKEGRIGAEKLEKYMMERISKPANLDEMAAAFGISKEHLCRCAKKLTGETVHGRWLSIKMDWARKLLQEESISVAEAGRRVGYKNPFYFSKAFKAFHGASPSEWRCSQK
jgi:AraC-type DNA-binding domain-containing proteins